MYCPRRYSLLAESVTHSLTHSHSRTFDDASVDEHAHLELCLIPQNLDRARMAVPSALDRRMRDTITVVLRVRSGDVDVYAHACRAGAGLWWWRRTAMIHVFLASIAEEDIRCDVGAVLCKHADAER